MSQRPGWAILRSLDTMFDRLRPGLPSGDLPSPEDDTAYTLFEGTALRFRNLSVEPLEDLRGDPGLVPGAFRIRIPGSRDSNARSDSLLRLRYASRGYQVPIAKSDSRLFPFCAYSRGDLVGTVSLRLDSPHGLAADERYKEQIDALRQRGQRCCEFTRLAVGVDGSSKQVLAALFHTAFLFAHAISGYDTSVIEVNPRHVVFYNRALGFKIIGPERQNLRVNAPAVLLAVPFQTIAEGLATYAGKPELARSTHSLFPYGFSARDAEGVMRRLQAFTASNIS